MGEIRPGDREEKAVRRVIDNDILTIIVRLVVGVTFIYASFYKIIDPGSFAKSIWYYHILPGQVSLLLKTIVRVQVVTARLPQ